MIQAILHHVGNVKRCAEQLGHSVDGASSAEEFNAAVTALRTACAELQQLDSCSNSSVEESGSIWGAACAIWVSNMYIVQLTAAKAL
jgi:hypothetical protein